MFFGDWKPLLDKWGRPGNFPARLQREVGKATKANAALLQREIRKGITDRRYAKNAKLTMLLKRGRRPLIETGDLLRGIQGWAMAWNKGFAGLFRAGPWGADLGLAEALHEGFSIRVTSRMRAMFRALSFKAHGWDVTLTGRAKELWDKNPNVPWRALAPGTTAIHVPGRPFIGAVFQDKSVRRRIFKTWIEAVERAVRVKGP